MLDRRFLSVNITVAGIANQPAENPTAGTQYIVGANPAGAFESAAPNSIARYDGSTWRFTAPKADGLEAVNIETGQILRFNGSAWVAVLSFGTEVIAPVLAIVPTGATLPATAATGDSFLNTADAKLYTATAADTWDSGTLTANGSRYASSTDYKVYQSDGTALTATAIPNGDMFLNKEDNTVYAYDASVPTFAKVGESPKTFTETHVLTAAEVTAKSFTLSHSIAIGQESNILLFVSGVAQSAGVDFTASGDTISWDSKDLDGIGLFQGDKFIIHYVMA